MLLACAPSAALAQEPASSASILITNGTSVPLACRLRTEATVWTDHQTIAPDYALTWPAAAGVRSYLECSPPVSATVYEIVTGQRYILIKDKKRPGVELRTMAPEK
ncbi:hypothetical protein [Sphingobium aromaticiconvertens]|uniref:hypothetical protein n=1 Tax=Sphingobium aromaticiconvertens TaxID=365341 RepID=UPI00301B480D